MTEPTWGEDPLAPLLLAPPAGGQFPVQYRSGQVVSWDRRTGENTLRIDGVLHVNVAVMPGVVTDEARPGDTVALLAIPDAQGVASYVVAGLALRPPDSRLTARRLPSADLTLPGYGVTLPSPVAAIPGISLDLIKVLDTSRLRVRFGCVILPGSPTAWSVALVPGVNGDFVEVSLIQAGSSGPQLGLFGEAMIPPVPAGLAHIEIFSYSLSGDAVGVNNPYLSVQEVA